jgi:hypothetical protein
MPNWVESDVTIICSCNDSEDLIEFVNGLKLSDDKEETSILNSYFPTPDELDISSPQYTNADKDQARLNVAKYGFADWYGWNLSNWGTKWYDVGTITDNSQMEEGYLFYSCNTPWNFPKNGMVEVSKKFPSLSFRVNYYECGMEFCGAFEVKNGEILTDEKMKYFGKRGG